MKLRQWLTVGLALTPLAAQPARADVRGDIQALVARYQRAFRQKDLTAIRMMMLPEFTVKSADGRVSPRQAVLTGLYGQMNAVRTIHGWTLNIEKLSSSGNTATVIMRERMDGTFNDGLGNAKRIVTTARLRETFRRGPAGWKYYKVEELSAQRTPASMSFVTLGELRPAKPAEVAARRAIEARYAEYQRAVRRGDLASAMSLMTPDFKMTYPTGRSYNHSQMENSLRQTIAATRAFSKWTQKVARIEIVGTRVRASVVEDMQTVVSDGSGRRHNQRVLDYFIDTWVKTPKGWKIQNTQVLKADVTVDGKPLDVFKGPA